MSRKVVGTLRFAHPTDDELLRISEQSRGGMVRPWTRRHRAGGL